MTIKYIVAARHFRKEIDVWLIDVFVTNYWDLLASNQRISPVDSIGTNYKHLDVSVTVQLRWSRLEMLKMTAWGGNMKALNGHQNSKWEIECETLESLRNQSIIPIAHNSNCWIIPNQFILKLNSIKSLVYPFS